MIKGLYEAHLPVSDTDRSTRFYRGLGLELAYTGPGVTFFWVEKGKSWLGLWPSEHAKTPYHPSIRHVAFYVELEDIKRVQQWLRGRGIHPRAAFGVVGEDQPLILQNGANYHAAIYFDDPDGNSLEFITPLKLDAENVVYHDGMTFEQWLRSNDL
ncbi:MAG: VOC family protein [Firmicutes bacterium]|nr:VOC family protein [Bacillota bacterium]